MGDRPSDRLREARKQRYDSAADAARAFGWTVSTYTHHENGTREYDHAQAQKYGRAFRVNWIWLLTGVDPRIEIDPDEATVLDLMANMTPEEREQAVAVLRALANKADREAS